MVDKENTLKTGKGSVFIKNKLLRLPEEEETWEADFRALPKPITQTDTKYVGFVLTQPDGFLLADLEVEELPTVNELATILAHAMGRPLINGQHRPRRIHLRRNSKWKPLIPSLNELGIEVEIKSNLPIVEQAFSEYLALQKENVKIGMTKASGHQANVTTSFPAIAKWVRGWGHIEIGDQEGFGFIVRAIDYGGVVFEDDKPSSLTEAMSSLERALKAYFKHEGVEID